VVKISVSSIEKLISHSRINTIAANLSVIGLYLSVTFARWAKIAIAIASFEARFNLILKCVC